MGEFLQRNWEKFEPTPEDDALAAQLTAMPATEPEHRLEKMEAIRELHKDLPPDSSVEEMDVGDEFVFVVRRGVRKEGNYNVMIPQHIDIVDSDWGGQNKRILTPREDDPDKLEAEGWWDMGIACRNSIQLAKTLEVPEGICVYFVYTFDEETDSKAARAVVDKWEKWPDIDLVLSAEIGPHIGGFPEDDERMRYTFTRRGILKIDGGIYCPRSESGEYLAGHAGIPGLPNAQDEYVRLSGAIEQQAGMDVNGPNDIIYPKLELEHHLDDFPGASLGPESISTWFNTSDKRPGLQHPQWSKFGWKWQLVPPQTLDGALSRIIEVRKRIAKEKDWAGRNIEAVFGMTDKETSYPPYASDPMDPAIQAIRNGLLEVSDLQPYAAAATSVADECFYSEGRAGETKKRPVVSISPRGGGAHGPHEWGSRRDGKRVMEAFRHIIEKKLSAVAAARGS